MEICEPFLFRFKQKCLSPERAAPIEDYEYDYELQMVMTTEDGRRIPAIEAREYQGPKTKKADIEKGDDQKDSRRWG